MRNLLLLSLLSTPLLGSLLVPERLGTIALINTPSGFVVHKDNKNHPVEQDCLDSTLSKMDYKQRSMYILNGGSLSLNQANTGEYTLKSMPNLKGGGIWGARIGAFLGKAVVSIVGHGIIIIVSAIASKKSEKGSIAIGIGLESTWGAAIEAASMKGAIIGGMIGAVATGPV